MRQESRINTPRITGGISVSGIALILRATHKCVFYWPVSHASITYPRSSGTKPKPSSERKVARDSVTEGARVTLSLYKHYRNALSLSLLLRKIQLPPGGSLCHTEHSVITFYLFSAHRHSLHRTPPLWRGFRDTRKARKPHKAQGSLAYLSFLIKISNFEFNCHSEFRI